MRNYKRLNIRQKSKIGVESNQDIEETIIRYCAMSQENIDSLPDEEK
jgi:hypothetical protein